MTDKNLGNREKDINTDVVEINEVSPEELNKKLESGCAIGHFTDLTTGRIMGVLLATGIALMATIKTSEAFPSGPVLSGFGDAVKKITGKNGLQSPDGTKIIKVKGREYALNLGGLGDALEKEVEKQSIITDASIRRADQAEVKADQAEAKADQAEAKADQAEAELQRIMEENEEGRKDLERIDRAIAATKKRIAQLRKDNVNLDRDNANLDRDNANLDKKLKKLNASIRWLQSIRD